MKNDERQFRDLLESIVMTPAAAFTFGYWQGSTEAGIAMLVFLAALKAGR